MARGGAGVFNGSTVSEAFEFSGFGRGDLDRLNPHKARNKAVHQLQAMGYHFTFDQAS